MEILKRMESDGEKAAETGAEIASALITELRPRVQGVYLMPAFNRYDVAAGIIETSK
jgi:homocysteine S-methyltransferase